jgi:CubicO group peptidase (beta-lactamase class C family)
VTIALLIAVLPVVGCSEESDTPRSDRPAPEATRSVGEEWRTTSPRAAGIDPAALEALFSRARRSSSFCTLVARDDRIVEERYFGNARPESSHQVYSVTKSVTSVLVGIAQDEGLLDVDDPASQWIPQWEGTPAEEVTVRDLLENDSGRAWSREIDYSRLLTQGDRTDFAVGLSQAHRPGAVWAYNNSAIQTLEAVLEEASGEDVSTFAYRRLFSPLGMDDSAMGADRAGNTQTFSGLSSTCRDLARFGLLMLQQGGWGDDQVVSADWVQESTGRAATKLNAAYGLLWWVNRQGVLTDPLTVRRRSRLDDPGTPRGRHVPGAPADTFWAQGLGGQVVQVDPGTRTVVVRIGPVFPPEGVRPFESADAAAVLDGVTPRS